MIYWLRSTAQASTEFELIETVADVRRVKAAGKTGGFLTFEGFEPLGVDLKMLDIYHDLGLRMATLTHSRRNIWADGTLPGLQLGGLTKLGKDAIRRMNELGIVVDLAHLSYPGCLEVLELSDAPVVLSHGSIPFMFRGGATPSGNAPGACDRDVRLLAEGIARNGGVIGEIAFGHKTLDAMLDDLDTLVSWIGIDHVGLGSDFFGMDMAPAGYESIDKLPAVTRKLVARGYADADILKVLGGNFLRVFGRVWH
jgi:membrane dipeptidase